MQCSSQYTNVDSDEGQTRRCTYTASRSDPSVNLVCIISGFKPTLNSFVWKGSSGTELSAGEFKQNDDGTWDSSVTVSVVARDGEDQNFTCEAEGLAVPNGRASVTVTVLGLPDDTSKRFHFYDFYSFLLSFIFGSINYL